MVCGHDVRRALRPRPRERQRGQTASLRSLAARNATFLLALILMASPVAGLRPMRAARCRTCRMPRPTLLEVFGDEPHHVGEHGFGLPLRNFVTLRQLRCQIPQGDVGTSKRHRQHQSITGMFQHPQLKGGLPNGR
jgi:hypothetical protein